MQASLVASAALTAEVATLKQDLEGSKKGRTLLPDSSTAPTKAKTSGCPGPSPWGDHKYSDTKVTHSIPLSHCSS